MNTTLTPEQAADAINALPAKHDLSVSYLAGYLAGHPCSCLDDVQCPPCRARAYMDELAMLAGVVAGDRQPAETGPSIVAAPREMMAYLATELFGWTWEQRGSVPRECWWDRKRGLGIWHERDYLLTGNGMLSVIEAMRKRGWRCHLYANGDYMAAFQRDAADDAPDETITFVQRTGLMLPEAVARAAYAALKEGA